MSMLNILLTILLFSCFLQIYGEERCPDGQVYDSCIELNTRCIHLNTSNESPIWPVVCSGGCKCKDNKYINEEGKCVDKIDCPNYTKEIVSDVIMNDIPRCPKNAEYAKCSNICPPINCYTYHQKRFCNSLRCGKGKCQCKPGYIRLSDKKFICIKPERCPKEKLKL